MMMMMWILTCSVTAEIKRHLEKEIATFFLESRLAFKERMPRDCSFVTLSIISRGQRRLVAKSPHNYPLRLRFSLKGRAYESLDACHE